MTSIEIAPLNFVFWEVTHHPTHALYLSPFPHLLIDQPPWVPSPQRAADTWLGEAPERWREMRPRRQVQHLDRNHLDVPLQWTSQWRGSTDARERGPSEGGPAERGARAPRPVRSLIRRRNRHKQGRDSTGYHCITKQFFSTLSQKHLSSHF